MLLKPRINDDLKTAMRAGDARRRDALRLLLAALKQREVDERKELADGDIIAVIDKMLKQRRDSIAQFEKGGRQDLADAEKFELEVLQAYMPQALSDAEIAAAVVAAMSDTGAAGPTDMGRVMAALKAKLAGRADMGKVSALVKSKLTS
ncbi:MAG: GatB/YqeY domain-containing protein [Betaproteobacteria bacterium]|nr:GatB/YqeY domain-containing protein [Betaproteobacteria bacterium]